MKIFHVGSVFGEVPPGLKDDSVQFRKIYNEELVHGETYSNLHSLCFDIGQRLSGTASAARAVKWGVQRMQKIGLDSVYTQEVMVPHWERGPKESAYYRVKNQKVLVQIVALGGSMATPKSGILAEIIEIKHFEELAQLGKDKIRGKIVFYNRPFNQTFINMTEAYGDAVPQRVFGALEAAKFGAIGVIIRSMSSTTDKYPHTGIMVYSDSIKKIPAAAMSTVSADLLTEALHAHPHLKFYFKQDCSILPPVKSFNVIGELRGNTFPDQVVLIGGHLDSWDLAQGAHDDGTGIVQSLEVLQLYKSLNIHPKRTIRVVFFMSEENGSAGGHKYAEIATAKNENHVAAIESDDGGFTPRGFEITTSDANKLKFESWKPLFVAYSSAEFKYSNGGGGADIETLNKLSSALIGYNDDNQRYFDIHHTANDLFSQVNARELKLGAASITSLVYLLDKYGL